MATSLSSTTSIITWSTTTLTTTAITSFIVWIQLIRTKSRLAKQIKTHVHRKKTYVGSSAFNFLTIFLNVGWAIFKYLCFFKKNSVPFEKRMEILRYKPAMGSLWRCSKPCLFFFTQFLTILMVAKRPGCSGRLATAQVEVVRVSIEWKRGRRVPPLPESSFFLPLHWLVSLPPASPVPRPPSHWTSPPSQEQRAANQRARRPWRPTAQVVHFSPEAAREASKSQWCWTRWRGWRSPTRCPCSTPGTGTTQKFFWHFSPRTRSWKVSLRPNFVTSERERMGGFRFTMWRLAVKKSVLGKGANTACRIFSGIRGRGTPQFCPKKLFSREHDLVRSKFQIWAIFVDEGDKISKKIYDKAIAETDIFQNVVTSGTEYEGHIWNCNAKI